MATITAQANLYQGTRLLVVDKAFTANLQSVFSLGNFNRPIQPNDQFALSANVLASRVSKFIIDIEANSGVTLTNQKFATIGGGNKVGVFDAAKPITARSTLRCKFPTFVRFDLEALGMPQGTDVIIQMEEGFVIEGDYPGSGRKALPFVENLFQFRTPKKFASYPIGQFALPGNFNYRIRPGLSTIDALFTPAVVARANKAGVIELESFATTSTAAIKQVVTGSAMSANAVMPNVNATRLLQFASTSNTIETVFSSDADKFKTPGIVTMSSTSTISASGDRSIGVITAIVSDAATMTTTVDKLAGVSVALTATASLSMSPIVILGITLDLAAVSSLSIEGSIPMVLETTGSSMNIPILYGSVNCVINWGDGTETTVTSPNANWITKNYSAPYGLGVVKQIRIAGYIQHYGYQTSANMNFGTTGYNEPSDASIVSQGIRNRTYFEQSQTITKIVSFGDLGTESFVGAFINARYLTSVATRFPSTVTNISRMFWHSKAADQFQNISNIANWNVSNVTQMEGVFIRNRNGFNASIGGWNVSNVTNMRDLFVFCEGFNADISSWDTGNVVNFRRTFYNAATFNQDIGSWDTGSALDMTGMFENAFSFNQDLTGWCVLNIPTTPANWANPASFSPFNWPVWGTCPP